VSYLGIQQSFTDGHHCSQPTARTALTSAVATGPVSAKRGVKVALPTVGGGAPPLHASALPHPALASWTHPTPACFCPPSPSLGIVDACAELEVPLDPGNLDADQPHGGGSCPGSHLHPQSTLHQQETSTCHPQSPAVQDFLPTAVCGLF